MDGEPGTTLTADDLILRPWHPADAPEVLAVCQDPEIARWVTIPQPFLPTDALTAVYYWRGTGTFTGPMDPPGFAPTRARVAFEGFELLEFRGDRLCRLRIVYDIMDLYRQMGVETTPV